MNVVEVADAPAFAADRIFCGMMLEAVRIHAELGLSPAQVDDACKTAARHLAVFRAQHDHRRELPVGALHGAAARPSGRRSCSRSPTRGSRTSPIRSGSGPTRRGRRCPPERLRRGRAAHARHADHALADMREHDIAGLDAINFLCENALAFREGVPALVERIGFDRARALVQGFATDDRRARARRARACSRSSPRTTGLEADLRRHRGARGRRADLDAPRHAVGHVPRRARRRARAALGRPAGIGDRHRARRRAQPRVRARCRSAGVRAGARRPRRGARAHPSLEGDAGRLRGGKPTVAALVGRVLGGGLELAAACDARIAGADQLAFPETTVGVIPGLGGCHHLHRSPTPRRGHGWTPCCSTATHSGPRRPRAGVWCRRSFRSRSCRRRA